MASINDIDAMERSRFFNQDLPNTRVEKRLILSPGDLKLINFFHNRFLKVESERAESGKISALPSTG